jgi:hypothetical protein
MAQESDHPDKKLELLVWRKKVVIQCQESEKNLGFTAMFPEIFKFSL